MKLKLTYSSHVEVTVTIVATDPVTATDAAPDHLEAIAGTTTTLTLQAATTVTESARIATLAVSAATEEVKGEANVEAIVEVIVGIAPTVTGPSEVGIVTEVHPVATLDAMMSSGSTEETATPTTTDAVEVEGTTGETMEDSAVETIAEMLRRHPRRENPLRT